MTKYDMEDLERYKQHLDTLQQALLLVMSDEPDWVKKMLLEEMGCDVETYGDFTEADDGQVYFHPISSKKTHTWSLETEIQSFVSAINHLNQKQKTND